MTHECGHAFQGYLAAEDLSGNMQILVWKLRRFIPCPWNFSQNPGIICFFGEKTTEDYTKMHLEDAIIFVPYGCMVDEFQHVSMTTRI